MNTTLLLGAALLTLVTSSATFAEEARLVRENIEWCDLWIPDVNAADMPHVLLIGDSITKGYYGGVAEALKGKASVARLATSKSLGDPAYLAEVALVAGQCKFDVVHFNNGMHGWGYTEEEYRKAFPELLATLRKHAPTAKLIWATTTPVRSRDKLADLDARTERVRARNRIAAEFVTEAGIATDDLFALGEPHPEYSSPDGVHFNGTGIAAQAAQVARMVGEAPTGR